MLKHATPRSSPCLSLTNPSPPHLKKQTPSTDDCSSQKKDQENQLSNLQSNITSDIPSRSESNSKLPQTQSSYNERGVDCDGIISRHSSSVKKGTNSGGLSLGSFWGDKILSLGSLSAAGAGIGPVITHGKAIVRRGLSFNSKKDSDSLSVRSVKSEGQGFQSDEVKRPNLPPKANSVMALQINVIKVQANGTRKEHLTIKKEEKACQKNSKESFSNKSSKEEKSNAIKHTSIRSSSKKIFGLSKTDHPSLKSLLRLPGVYGHIPVPESAPSGTPHILSPDSLSLNSSDSFVSSNSGRTSSRSWSSNTSSNSNNTSDSSNSNCSSTSEPASTTLKIFAKCLRSDIEYKTVNIGSRVTCRHLINLLLSKARMKHRDPNLFYLTMEVTVRRWSGVPVRALLVLEDSARPAQLALCRPSGDLKFVLQMRRGGVIKIHDTVLMPGSQYKSLLVSYRTTSEEAVQLLLNCYGRRESRNYYALHEVCQSPHYNDRRLGLAEKPLEAKAEWPRDRRAEFVFVLRRNMTQALSLRKLSMRTLENRNNQDDERTNSCTTLPAVTTTLSLPETKKIEQTLIDCTSTTPVMLTFIRKESDSDYPCEGNLKESSSQNQIEEKTPLRTSLQNTFNVTYPLTFYKKNITEENDCKNNNSTSSAFTERWHNSSSRITFHSLPKVQKPFPSNLNYSKMLSQHHESDGNIFLDHNCLSQLAKFNPQYYLPKPRVSSAQVHSSKIGDNVWPVLNNKRSKLLSTSAVQTELTCIPLKGLKAKQKWNSVETLLETRHSSNNSSSSSSSSSSKGPKMLITKELFFNDVPATKAEHENESKDVNDVENKEKSQTITSDANHKPGKQCNCEECFYI